MPVHPVTIGPGQAEQVKSANPRARALFKRGGGEHHFISFIISTSAEQCLRPVDLLGGVYLPGDRVESQAMTGVGAPAGKVQPDAHRSPWRGFRPRRRDGWLAVADR